MSNNNIKCCILGGQEKDLFILGELHKRAGVSIVFVYDRDSSGVGLEIAEILGVPVYTDPSQIPDPISMDYIVTAEPRAGIEEALHALSGSGATVISHADALRILCGHEPPSSAAEAPPSPEEKVSINDTLGAFERILDRNALLKFLLDVAVQATAGTAGSVMLFGEESKELHIGYATGLSERVIRTTRQKLGEGIAGGVAEQRAGRLIKEPRAGSLYQADRDRIDIATAVSVPLLWEEQLLGVLNVSAGHADDPLEEHDLDVLTRLSHRIARVLNESIKLQRVKMHHQEVSLRQSMGELTERAIASNTKFSLISNLLSEMLGADTAEIFISTHAGDWLVLGGSNRRLSTKPDIVRCGKGAMSRAFLERRTVTMAETSESGRDDKPTCAVLFVPLGLTDPLGVLMLEFCEPGRLESFRMIEDAVALELSRFIASERRERRLTRELTAVSTVSDAAPLLLSCRTVDELCEFAARLVTEVLECARVSVRIHVPAQESGAISRYDDSPDRTEAWYEEDEERYMKLKAKGEPFTTAFLNFVPTAADRAPAYHSLMAIPVKLDDAFIGGIIAYDKRPEDAMEDATFTDLDRSVLQQIVSLIVPVVRTLGQAVATPPAGDEETDASLDTVLRGNLARLKKIIEGEMSRADRYHNSFSLLLVRIELLDVIFEDDPGRARILMDEIMQGVRTRTRKTDYSTWIRRSTLAMVSLEGSRRLKFLVSRLVQYLLKDLSAVGGRTATPRDIHVSFDVYPGTAKTADALISDVEKNLQPHSDD